MLAAACRRLLLHAICAAVRETNALSISNHHFSARLCKAVPSLFSAPRLSRLCPGTISESMLGLSSAFFGHSKTDIQAGLHAQKREVSSVLASSGLGASDVTTSLARKLALTDSTLAHAEDAAAQVKQHVTSLSAVTVSLPQAGARVADTRDAAKSAAEVAAAAVASVMKAKAELHSRQDAASAAGRGVVDAYKADIAAKVKVVEAAAAAEVAVVARRL